MKFSVMYVKMMGVNNVLISVWDVRKVKLYTQETMQIYCLLTVHTSCRRVWSLCHSTLALNMFTIAHAALIKPRFHIAPRGTQHLWNDLLKGRCNLPP